jgi:hypothetical protein
VDLASLDDKDVTSATLECFAIDGPHATTFPDELNLIVRMPMRARAGTGFPVEQEYRNISVTLLGPNKLMRTSNKRQVFLAHVMHASRPPQHWMSLIGVQASTMPVR